MYYMCLDSFLFFFFKQKTAYEMRISDWSSDVCSSDLIIFVSRTSAYRRQVSRSGLRRFSLGGKWLRSAWLPRTHGCVRHQRCTGRLLTRFYGCTTAECESEHQQRHT